MGLAEDVDRIAVAAAALADGRERLVAVLPAEPADGERLYLCAFEGPDESKTWIALDEHGSPVSDRKRVRDAASIAALVEIAEESSATPLDEEPRLASAAYLDSIGTAGEIVGALQGALPAVEELTRDVELHYRLELS